MCEEVEEPSTQVPRAMVGTIIMNFFAGLLFLISLVFVLPDLTELINLPSGQPLPTIIASAVGSEGGTFGLLVPLLVLAIFCGIGCTTATSRCTWAFARDGAIPGSKWWKVVNKKLDVPLNAMMLTMVVEILLGLIYFGSTAAFNAFSGVGVICLTLSYAVPIVVSLLGGRTHLKYGKFDLGFFGLICNIVSICKLSLLLSPKKNNLHRCCSPLSHILELSFLSAILTNISKAGRYSSSHFSVCRPSYRLMLQP
jgi:amino acid transporter